MKAKRDYYEILGVNKSADDAHPEGIQEAGEEISSGFNAGDAAAEEKFKEINRGL